MHGWSRLANPCSEMSNACTGTSPSRRQLAESGMIVASAGARSTLCGTGWAGDQTGKPNPLRERRRRKRRERRMSGNEAVLLGGTLGNRGVGGGIGHALEDIHDGVVARAAQLDEGELSAVGRDLVVAEDVHRALALLRREHEVGAEAQHPAAVEQLGVDFLGLVAADIDRKST